MALGFTNATREIRYAAPASGKVEGNRCAREVWATKRHPAFDGTALQDLAEIWHTSRSWRSHLRLSPRCFLHPCQRGIHLLGDLAVSNLNASRGDGRNFGIVGDEHNRAALLAQRAKELKYGVTGMRI